MGYRETMRGILCLSVASMCVLAGCGNDTPPPAPTLTVAAAANLTGAAEELDAAFEAQTRFNVTLSLGSTAQLAQQMANGAPFDVLLAADTEHIDKLIGKGKLRPDSRAVYALGRLALWIPDETRPEKTLRDLASPSVKFIAVAQPDLAPYGLAAIEALKRSGLWDRVRTKLVYANNINMARQLAASGNADAALTAYPLVMNDRGRVIKIDSALHGPLEQAVGVASATPSRSEALAFRDFVLGPQGRAILSRRGFELP